MADLPVRPASTVLTLRDGERGVEVLMVRRNPRSEFVGGVYVFPGGAVDEDDRALGERVLGWDESVAARQGLGDRALEHVAAGLRELFEEAGLLVACDRGGRPVALADRDDRARMARHRRRLNDRLTTMGDVLDAEDLFLDARALRYLANWVTPIGPPRRYDTRFFVVRAPEGQVAAHDDAETVENRWVRPLDALDAHRRGVMEMVLPTVVTLTSVADLASTAEVLDFAAGLARVERVEPRVVARGDGLVVEADGVGPTMRAPDSWGGGVESG